MTDSRPAWSLKEFVFHIYDKSAEITGVRNGKCFCIRTAPENFYQSPDSLERYIRLLDERCDDDDEDMEKAQIAEEELQEWVVQPFLPLIDQLEPSPSSPLNDSDRPLTLHDYLYPETYRFVLHVRNEQQEASFDYDTPRELGLPGVGLRDWAVSSGGEWKVFRPSEIQLCCEEDDVEPLAQSPQKVTADGEVCFYKQLVYGDEERAIREMDIYRRLETLGPATGERTGVHVPRLYGVVQDEQSARVLGLIASWIDCGNKTLTCALLYGNKPELLRRKWDQQVSSTVAYLHEAGVVWGDAKAENVLVDTDDNAWVIDFGGGYTRGWVGRDRMETIEGDQEGLSKIKELLYQE